jgi:hypothetical protein
MIDRALDLCREFLGRGCAWTPVRTTWDTDRGTMRVRWRRVRLGSVPDGSRGPVVELDVCVDGDRLVAKVSVVNVGQTGGDERAALESAATIVALAESIETLR